MKVRFYKQVAALLMFASCVFAKAHAAAEPAAFLTNYVNIVHATYADSLQAAQAMQK
jgi:uncharacterized iron-regulated protein